MNIKKNYLLIVSVFILFSYSKLYGQFQFEPVGLVSLGYEDNVFHAPDILLDNLGNYIPESDLIISDMFLDYGYNLGFNYKTKKHLFHVDQGFWGRNYFDYNQLNQYVLDLKLKYKYAFSKHFATGVIYDISKNKKIGTSALGDELLQKFSYLKNDVEILFDYEITRNTDIELAFSWYNKDYEKDSAVVPLDANTFGTDFKFAQDLNSGNYKSTLNLKINYAMRKYSDLRALDASGNSNPDYPLRDWRYFGAGLEYKIDHIGNFAFVPYYWYDSRKDQFEDYYSYKSNEMGLKIYLKSDKFNLKLVPFYSIVKYDVKKAPGPDATDPLLVYEYFDIDLQMNYLLFKGTNLTFDFNTSNRNTNTLSESMTTRRDYKSYEIMVGFSFNPFQLFVDRKIDEDERK